MENKFTIDFDKRITEQFLIETCLNQVHSGIDCNLVFFFYALSNRWHIDKFNYYYNLIFKSEVDDGK